MPRPGMRMRRRSSEKGSLRRRLLCHEYGPGSLHPSITLGGTAGLSNAAGAVVSNPGQWLFTAVGSLVEPLFARGRNRANLKIARAQQEEALVNFRQSLLTAGAEVNDALVQWQTARQRLVLDNRQIEAQRRTAHVAQLAKLPRGAYGTAVAAAGRTRCRLGPFRRDSGCCQPLPCPRWRILTGVAKNNIQ